MFNFRDSQEFRFDLGQKMLGATWLHSLTVKAKRDSGVGGNARSNQARVRVKGSKVQGVTH